MGARPLKRLIQNNIEDQILDFYFKKSTDNNKEFYFYIEEGSVKYNLV